MRSFQLVFHDWQLDHLFRRIPDNVGADNSCQLHGDHCAALFGRILVSSLLTNLEIQTMRNFRQSLGGAG